MFSVWLYHINPKSRYGYRYGWNIERPETIFRSGDRTWESRKYRNKVEEGDIVCVYMKRMRDKPDGIYVVGKVSDIAPEDGTFTWEPDRRRSARTLHSPILPAVIRRFFPRSYGDSMQPLAPAKRDKWMALLGAREWR